MVAAVVDAAGRGDAMAQAALRQVGDWLGFGVANLVNIFNPEMVIFGGTLRDVLLDRRPFFWVAHSEWLWVLLALGIAGMVFLRARHFAPTERAMQWPDALGLGLLSASGTQLALDQDLPGIVAVLMGVITATFGGVLRDIVCNEIPTALRDHRPYAICAFAGGWVLVLAQHGGVPASLGMVLAATCASCLRCLALVTGYSLPRWSSGREDS